MIVGVRRAARLLVAGGLAAGTILAVAGCRHHGAGGSAADFAPDSLSGIVSVTGTAFEQRLVLRADDRTMSLTASAADSFALSRVGGTEVVVRGVAGEGAFSVVSFTVRSVEGRAVADGVLRRDGDRLVLDTPGASIALGNPPSELRSMVGARVWIGGPLDTGPNSYGVIVPAP